MGDFELQPTRKIGRGPKVAVRRPYAVGLYSEQHLKLTHYQLSGGEAGADARGRAPPAQGAQQPGREFAPADQTTRTADEAVQVSPTGATVPLGARPDQQPLPPAPRSPSCRRVPSRSRASLRDLGRGHGQQSYGLTAQAGSAPQLSSAKVIKLTVPRAGLLHDQGRGAAAHRDGDLLLRR